MLNYIKKIVIFACTCVSLLFSSMASAANFLPPDQAFAFNASMRDGQHVQITFDIAPNYYMYRDEFNFAVVSPDGKVMQSGDVKLPNSLTKFDENFNKNVSVYHGQVSVIVPIKGDGLFKLVVTSRGCADSGLCYPPRKTQAVLTAMSTNTSAENANIKLSEKTAVAGASKPDNTQATNEVKSSNINQVPLPLQNLDATGQAQLSTQTMGNQNASQDAVALSTSKMSLEPNAENPSDNSAYARNLFDHHYFPIAMLLVFGLGILLSLTPCMLPMMPILMTILADQQNVSKRRGLSLAIAYVTGMAIVYAIIGVAAAKTGASLHRYLQSPWILGVFSGLLFIMALSLFDVFHIHMPAKLQHWLNSKTHGKSGLYGVTLMGAASALIASPCVTAPLVGLITYIAQTGNVLLGGLALFVLAYGMGLPLLLLGAGFGRFIPKGGTWMTRVKQMVGVIMLIAAVWIAQPLWGKYWKNAWGQKQVVTFQAVKSITALSDVVAQSDQPVFVDLYADWCRSCIEMETKTFSDPRVQERMSGMKLIRVDMTAYTDDDAALLKHFGLYGPPAMIVLDPLTGKEKLRVIGFESPEKFVNSLDGTVAAIKK